MAKKMGKGGVFSTREEAQGKAAELKGGKWRVIQVSVGDDSYHVVAGSEGHALHQVFKAGHLDGVEIVGSHRAVTTDAAIAAIAGATLTAEQKAALKKVLK